MRSCNKAAFYDLPIKNWYFLYSNSDHPSTVITPAKNLDIRKALQHVGTGAKRKPSGSPGDKDLDSVHLIKRPSEEQKDGT